MLGCLLDFLRIRQPGSLFYILKSAVKVIMAVKKHFELLLFSLVLTTCVSFKSIPVTELAQPYSNHPKGIYGNYYEIFVGSFYDSDGDGMGDFRGIIEKIDYLNDGNPDSDTSLNIDGIWLMPIHPSPTYHKYDVMDYMAIDPAYGTMADFEDFMAVCKERGIRVIIDLVPNHSSARHPWFLAAKKGVSRYRSYYNISKTKYNSTWKSFGGGLYYEAVFWDQMPDLNWNNKALKNEFEKIVDFWLDKGAAGFRLDAVKHIHEFNTTETRRQNHPQNIEWLRWFADYCRSKKADVYIVSEVWDAPSVILSYYTAGAPSNFNFPAAQRSIPQHVKVPDTVNFAEYAANWNAKIKEKSGTGIDAPFISNHDTNRIAHVLDSDPVALKMAASLLLFMPGNPFIYYGDELGMTGDGMDEHKRGPMRWSRTDRTGETKGPKNNSQPYWDNSSVSEQLADPNSILRFYIDALRLKNKYPVIHWGTPSPVTVNDSVSAYKITGKDGEGNIAVVHNVSDNSRTITITGAAALGGTLNAKGAAKGAAAEKPVLSGNSLTMPAYTTAIIEY